MTSNHEIEGTKELTNVHFCEQIFTRFYMHPDEFLSFIFTPDQIHVEANKNLFTKRWQ